MQVGLCKSYGAPNAQTVQKALERLQNDLRSRRHLYDNGAIDEWCQALNSYQVDLRKLWERAVEEALAPVVKRFRNKVETGGLELVAVIEQADCDKMREGYGRCSKLLHSDSEELNLPIPTPEMVQEELNCIMQWMESIKKRQSNK